MSEDQTPAGPDLKTLAAAQLAIVKAAAEKAFAKLPVADGSDPEHLKSARGHIRGVIEGTAAVIEAVGREW